MEDKKVNLTFKAPAPVVCMTYTDSDNKMTKIIYGNNNNIENIEVTQLPQEENRDFISCIMEYSDGTIITNKITNEAGNVNVHVNKPVIYNIETGE